MSELCGYCQVCERCHEVINFINMLYNYVGCYDRFFELDIFVSPFNQADERPFITDKRRNPETGWLRSYVCKSHEL